MGLNSFVAQEARPLPIFILADASGSMSGPKIQELNLALRDMVSALNNVTDIRGKFQLCVISFGNDTINVVQPLTDLANVSLTELVADGNTPMGGAFDHVSTMIEDRAVVSSRAYAPTIVLISDGMPTDFPGGHDYYGWAPLAKLHSGQRSSKCQRLAMGIGNDADMAMLKAFVKNDQIPVIKSNGAKGIASFFRWVTMSTIARAASTTPNNTSVIAPITLMDEEDITI